MKPFAPVHDALAGTSMSAALLGRRAMLRRSLAAAGSVMLAGCASGARQRGPLAPRHRLLAPVHASRERVIREIAGLRPFRPQGFVVRGESLGDHTVVHNYGHGGGGISLCWGSSALAVESATATGQRRFAVIGCGVMGLTTARLLQDRGFEATIYTKDLPPDTTSNIAGGQWSPFTVSDAARTTAEFRTQFERAARLANRYYQNLVGSGYGVRWIENYVLRDQPFPQQQQTPIGDLYFDEEVLSADQHPFAAPYVRRFTTMLVEPPVFIGAVTRDFLLRGGRMHVREFRERSQLRELEERVIVNCTGLGSSSLFGDTDLLPIKGQLSILLPQPEVDYIMLSGGYYMFPRSDGIVLGGTHERGESSLTIDPAASSRIVGNHQAIFRAMKQRPGS
jgi:glycine/D-amino acid oxidase-like deaminating enzyme